MLDILESIDDFCRNNNINYYLAYGSLLGAIRHDGFIPWDDDVDILMPRPDYDFFRKNFQHSYYKIHSNDGDSFLLFDKIYDSRTVCDEGGPIRWGIFIDIFPLDGLSSDIKDARLYISKMYRWFVIYNWISICKELKVSSSKSFGRNLALLLSRIIIPFIPIKYLRKRLLLKSHKYKYEDSKYVGFVFSEFKEPYVKDDFGVPRRHCFEDRTFSIPINPHRILQQTYGDYMTFPPENERVYKHNIKAYWL